MIDTIVRAKRYKCPSCSYTAKYDWHLQKHMVLHSSTDRPWKCLQCSCSFKRVNDLRAHENFLHEREAGKSKFPCNICDKIFTSGSNLAAHMRTHTGEKPFVCPTCQKAFRHSSHLYRHSLTLHGTNAKTEVVVPTELCPFKKDYWNSIQYMNKKESRPLHQRNSIQDTHGDKWLSSTKSEESSSRMEVDMPFRGDWRKFFIIKIRAYDGMRQHVCRECGKGFSIKLLARRHAYVHLKEKPHSCPLCPKTFRLLENLKRHAKTHAEEKQYQCPECPRKFSQSANLMAHLSSHKEEKRYKCKECSRSFSAKRSLNCHMQLHREKAPTLFKCSKCNKSFRHMASLKYHMLRDLHGENVEAIPLHEPEPEPAPHMELKVSIPLEKLQIYKVLQNVLKTWKPSGNAKCQDKVKPMTRVDVEIEKDKDNATTKSTVLCKDATVIVISDDEDEIVTAKNVVANDNINVEANENDSWSLCANSDISRNNWPIEVITIPDSPVESTEDTDYGEKCDNNNGTTESEIATGKLPPPTETGSGCNKGQDKTANEDTNDDHFLLLPIRRRFGTKQFICAGCGETFAERREFLRHVNKEHSDLTVS